MTECVGKQDAQSATIVNRAPEYLVLKWSTCWFVRVPVNWETEKNEKKRKETERKKTKRKQGEK